MNHKKTYKMGARTFFVLEHWHLGHSRVKRRRQSWNGDMEILMGIEGRESPPSTAGISRFCPFQAERPLKSNPPLHHPCNEPSLAMTVLHGCHCYIFLSPSSSSHFSECGLFEENFLDEKASVALGWLRLWEIDDH